MRSIFISDVHIGHKNSNCFECLDKIESLNVDKIYLNGDIIDIHAIVKTREFWYIQKPVIKKFLKLIKRDKIKVVYILGNHDWQIFPLALISWIWRVRIKLWHKTKTKMIEHGWLIPPLLKIKQFFSKTKARLDGKYFEQRKIYAKLINKDLIVGHTHIPSANNLGNVSVFDSGDWVEGHNSYLLEINGVMMLFS